MDKKLADLKIAFFGTPQFSVWVLEELQSVGIVPALVIAAPDKPRGRGLKLTPPPAKVWAEERNIDILQPEKIDDAFIDELANTGWDLFLVASYGKILPKRLIELPQYGSLNVHPSLLPKLRGASPIQSAILTDAKDAVGVSIMVMDEKMDHGPIVAQASIGLEAWPLRFSILEELLAHEGGKLLAEVIPQWVSGEITPEKQDHSAATFSKKITKEDGEISLDGDPYQNFLKIRALEGWPGTYFFLPPPVGRDKDIRVKIVDAQYNNEQLTITRVIPEGKREMNYEDFLRASAA